MTHSTTRFPRARLRDAVAAAVLAVWSGAGMLACPAAEVPATISATLPSTPSTAPSTASSTTPSPAPPPLPVHEIRVDRAGRFGLVTALTSSALPDTVVLYLSGRDGFHGLAADQAHALASTGAAVVEAPYPQYAGHYRAKSRTGCAWPSIDFQVLGKRVDHMVSLPSYLPPVLVAEGAGTAIALTAFTQAPPGTFAGLVTVDFSPSMESGDPPCSAQGRIGWEPGAPKQPGRITPPARLYAPWITIETKSADGTIDADVTAFVNRAPGAALVALDPAAAGGADPERVTAAIAAAVARIAHRPMSPAPSGLMAELPLVELPDTVGSGDTLTVFASGDGGWAMLDELVSEQLNAHGVPVVGWNSGRYYWANRGAGEAARDLERIARRYLDAWHKQRLLLVGYSSGADSLAVLAHRLPQDLLDRVRAIALIGPSDEADELMADPDPASGTDEKAVSLASEKHAAPTSGVATLPEIGPLKGRRILCFHGLEEKESLCTGLPAGLAQVVDFRAGHGFKGDQNAIGQAILQFAP